MSRAISFAYLLILGSVLSVNGLNVVPHSKVAFDLPIMEHGTQLIQHVEVDKTAGVIINNVPAHNNRIAARFVMDQASNLILEVQWIHNRCLVYEPYSPISADNLVSDASGYELATDGFVHENETELVKLTTVFGPELHQEALPVALKGHCPETFRLFLAKQVLEDDISNEVQLPEEIARSLMQPNATSTDLTGNGDHVRRKRYACECDASDLRFRCVVSTNSCQYTILCPKLRYKSKQCMRHDASGNLDCSNQCCTSSQTCSAYRC